MYRLNHDDDKAIAAFNTYLELTQGADPAEDQKVADEIKAMGGTPVTEKKPDKPKSKKKSKKK